jgi:holo-[acyl-carrier protein] synthase
VFDIAGWLGNHEDMRLRAGTDLVQVAAVQDSLQNHGRHYLERVYTERELADCQTAAGIDPERLAARFAAKEATIKVLRPGEQGMSLKCIEVHRDPEGWVELRLSGPAAELAERVGITDLALSLTHEGGFASAMVVAQLPQAGP